MESYVGKSRDMLTFIEKSPSCFHAVDNLKAMLKERGFTVQSGKSFGLTARQYAVHYER